MDTLWKKGLLLMVVLLLFLSPVMGAKPTEKFFKVTVGEGAEKVTYTLRLLKNSAQEWLAWSDCNPLDPNDDFATTAHPKQVDAKKEAKEKFPAFAEALACPAG
jgi:hypothetical protein